MHVDEAFHHRNAQRQNLVIGMNEIGHHHRLHPRGMGRVHAGQAILEREAICRADFQPSRRRQIGLGMGFGMGHIVPRHHGFKEIEQTRCAEVVLGMGVSRGGRHGRRDIIGMERGDEIVHAGLYRHAVMGARPHGDAALFVEQGIGKADAIGLKQKPVGVLVTAADHGTMDVIGHFEAKIGADFENDGLEDGFGVEQGAVHIEDGGLKGCKLYHLA